jgi:hypothetical protein
MVANEEKLWRGNGTLDLPERESVVFRFSGSERRNEYRAGAWKS